MAITGGTVQTLDPFSEALATLPDVSRQKRPGDGTEPKGAATPAAPAADGAKSAPKTLETTDEPTLFKAVDHLVRSHERLARNRWAIDQHYDLIRNGVPFTRLEKIPNVNQWVQRLPNGMSKQVAGAVPNKADDLCNKVEDTLMSDPPKPDPSRHVNDESARQAAELAARVLYLDGLEAGTNDAETYRWALNNAFARSASILHYRVDPDGGGYQPLQVLADPLAQDPQNPLQYTDPATQLPMQSTNPVLRYVTPSNQFTDDATQADKVWLPKIVVDRLRREQIRTFPYNKPPEQADAVVLIRWMTLADACHEWPDTVGKMTEGELKGLAQWRPPMAEVYGVPYAFMGIAAGGSGPGLDDVGTFAPLLQRRMYAYRLYIKATPEYEKGYWCDLNGGDATKDTKGVVLAEGDMEYTVKVPDAGQVTRCRQIPVVMIRPQQDVSGGDPLGWPFISRFAGASEANSTLYAAFADMCDNMLHPHVFIRSVTSVDEDDWSDRTVPIILGPQDPEPTYEHFPTMPPVMEFLTQNNTAMDVSSGLTATAQGLDTATSVSGVAKQLSVRQALVSLSGFQQNLHAGMTRGWNIKCELIQAEFKTPQLLKYVGEDASAETTWWTGEDFGGIDRVGIQPGTGTMMTPEGKAQYVAFLQAQQWMPPEDAADVALPSIRMDLGIPENPVIAWLERCISAWMQGPPQGWVPAYQKYQQDLQAFQAQQQQAQAQMQAHAQQMQTGAATAQGAQAAQAQQQQAAQQAQDATRAHEAEMQKMQLQHQQAMEMERHKAGATVALETAKHQHALQLAQLGAAHQQQQAVTEHALTPPPVPAGAVQ